jgi:hypothetical protein
MFYNINQCVSVGTGKGKIGYNQPVSRFSLNPKIAFSAATI